MTAVPDSPSAPERAPRDLRQRAKMLLPVVIPLMVVALIRIGDSSRAGLVVAAVVLVAVAVGSLVWARRRTVEQPDD